MASLLFLLSNWLPSLVSHTSGISLKPTSSYFSHFLGYSSSCTWSIAIYLLGLFFLCSYRHAATRIIFYLLRYTFVEKPLIAPWYKVKSSLLWCKGPSLPYSTPSQHQLLAPFSLYLTVFHFYCLRLPHSLHNNLWHPWRSSLDVLFCNVAPDWLNNLFSCNYNSAGGMINVIPNKYRKKKSEILKFICVYVRFLMQRQNSLLAENTDSRAKLPGLKSWFCHLLAGFDLDKLLKHSVSQFSHL